MNFAKNCSKKLSRQLQHVDWDGHLSSTKCIFPAIVTTFALKDEWEGQKEAAFFAHCFFFFFHFVVIIQGAKTRVDFDILRIAIRRVLLSTYTNGNQVLEFRSNTKNYSHDHDSLCSEYALYQLSNSKILDLCYTKDYIPDY